MTFLTNLIDGKDRVEERQKPRLLAGLLILLLPVGRQLWITAFGNGPTLIQVADQEEDISKVYYSVAVDVSL